MCGVVGIYSKDKDISKQLYYSLYSVFEFAPIVLFCSIGIIFFPFDVYIIILQNDNNITVLWKNDEN